jgi:23S rRNA (guanosine2251-2'-O)-methyltransferase
LAKEKGKEMNVIYGQHSVKAALSEGRLPQTLYTHKAKAAAVRQCLLNLEYKIPVKIVDNSVLDEMTANANHQGWVAVYAKAMKTYYEDKLAELLSTKANFLFLVLDGVQDPHNLGACLRSADASAVTAVIIPKDNAVGLTATVQKVASGAAENVILIQVTNLARSLQELKQAGVWLYGLSEDAATSLYDIDLTGPVALLLGAEEKGLRRLTREAADALVFLPMLGHVSSLNVSVATGICLYEVLRQRR